MNAEFWKALWVDYLYHYLCIVLPCIVYQVIVYRKGKRKSKVPVKHFVWSHIFILYIFMALHFAGIGSIWDIGLYGSVIRTEEISFIPFQSEGVLTYALNVIMFMPLGFLLPLIWEKYRSMRRTVLTGAVFSLAIEAGQLFNRRHTDIDDLLMNTLGTVIGFCIWVGWSRLIRGRKEKDDSLSWNEAAIYLGMGILGSFLLFNVWVFLKWFYF